jgi:hypothetical protein
MQNIINIDFFSLDLHCFATNLGAVSDENEGTLSSRNIYEAEETPGK